MRDEGEMSFRDVTRAELTLDRMRFAARVFLFWTGLFTLLHVAGDLHHPSFDSDIWPASLEPVGLAGNLLLAAAAVALVLGAIRVPGRGWKRNAVTAGVLVIALAALGNMIAFDIAWSRGDIDPAIPLPLSLVFGVLLVLAGLAIRRPAERLLQRPRVIIAASVSLAVIVGVPLAEFALVGTVDHRSEADAVVVLGARVYEDGHPSDSLVDRMNTASRLYLDGFAGTLIVSGGEGEGGHNEAEVMKQMAVDQGVPADAIITDTQGVSTEATVADTGKLFQDKGLRRVLVVSHFYHLPRVSLAYGGEGQEVLTVPSGSSAAIGKTALVVAREIPAFWKQYVTAALG